MKRSVEELLPLHPLEFRILLALLDGPSYGTRIVESVEASADGGARLYPANLYRRIRSLRSQGLLEEADPPADADPRRSYLRVTGFGRRVAAAEARRLKELLADAVTHDLLRDA